MEKQLEKIEKLLRKAERASTEAEAEAFYAKAQELMTKWAIDEAMLRTTEEGLAEDVTTDSIVIKRSGYFKSNVAVVQACAAPNNVKVLLRSPKSWGKEAGVVLVGFPSDIANVKLLFASMMIQIGRASRNAPAGPDAYEAGIYRISFRFGFAERLRQRLEDARVHVVEEVSKTTGTSVALALVDRSKAVQNFYDSMTTTKARRSTTRRWNEEGARAGRAAADRADVGATRIAGNRGALPK
jgi:phosphopantetheinyl transferase (holo-ACP synthase)